MKRAIDVLGSVIGLLVLSPIAAILYVAIRFDSVGPPIFMQTRVGANGKPFTCYKFRTMYFDTRDVPTHEVSRFAVTRIGRFLRATKVDEFPQLYNVLRGDMTLVGPRPCLVMQTALIEARRLRGVYHCLPGITGLAQVRGIDMSDPEKLAEVDAEYLQTSSTFLDFRILFATVVGIRICPV